MASIESCKDQKDGFAIIEPNEEMAESYLSMAEESLRTLSDVSSSKLWTATITYYAFYYSLYALMIRCGIKSGTHACSFAFMDACELFSEREKEKIRYAFQMRIDLQYYSDRVVDEKRLQRVTMFCPSFFIKAKDLVATISEREIERIRALI